MNFKEWLLKEGSFDDAETLYQQYRQGVHTVMSELRPLAIKLAKSWYRKHGELDIDMDDFLDKVIDDMEDGDTPKFMSIIKKSAKSIQDTQKTRVRKKKKQINPNNDDAADDFIAKADRLRPQQKEPEIEPELPPAQFDEPISTPIALMQKIEPVKLKLRPWQMKLGFGDHDPHQKKLF